MTFNTVGELIKALKEFDPSTPVLKSITADADCPYKDIELSVPLLFRVKPCYFGFEGYTDCSHNHTGSFDAVVL